MAGWVEGIRRALVLGLPLLNYYIADMPRPTPLVKRVCYLRDVVIYLKENSLLISYTEINSHKSLPWTHTSARHIQRLLLKIHNYH